MCFAAVFSFRPISDSDSGWHLALGRMIAGGEFPHVNSLAWTQPDHHFYPTSWLFDWLGYVLTRAFGLAGLQLMVLAFAGVTLGCVAWMCAREGHGRWLVVPIALLLMDRTVPRPHMASWAILAACTAICLSAERRGGWRRAWCIPLIALGSNFHAGAIFSSVALGLFCLAEAIRERTVRAFVREGSVALTGVLALMANPGGTYNVFYAVRHLSMYETLQLTEFEAPNLSNAGGFFVVGPLSAVAAAMLIKKRPGLSAVTAAFVAGGIFAVRLAFKFYLVAAPTLAAALGQVKERFGARTERYAALLLVGAALVVNAQGLASLRLGSRFDEQWIPVRAVEFAKRVGLDGKVWNGFNDGGYLEWALPEVPAFQDARVLAYDAEFFHAQQRAESSPEEFERHLRGWGVEWALTTNSPSGLSGSGLIRSPEWALVYWDDLSEIYVRRDVPRLAHVVTAHEYRTFHPWLSTDELLRRAKSGSLSEVEALEREITRFEQTTPSHPIGRLARCAVATRLARPEASTACAEARELAPSDAWSPLVDAASSP